MASTVYTKKISEKVIQMKQNFMQLHNDGKSILEVAEIYNLDFSTVYSHLHEIAAENGTTRVDLLSKVYVRRKARLKNNSTPNSPTAIDSDELSESFDSVFAELNNLITSIDCISKKLEEDTKEE